MDSGVSRWAFTQAANESEEPALLCSNLGLDSLTDKLLDTLKAFAN